MPNVRGMPSAEPPSARLEKIEPPDGSFTLGVAVNRRRDGLLPPGDVVARLNRLLTGWANYFLLG